MGKEKEPNSYHYTAAKTLATIAAVGGIVAILVATGVLPLAALALGGFSGSAVVGFGAAATAATAVGIQTTGTIVEVAQNAHHQSVENTHNSEDHKKWMAKMAKRNAAHDIANQGKGH